MEQHLIGRMCAGNLIRLLAAERVQNVSGRTSIWSKSLRIRIRERNLTEWQFGNFEYQTIYNDLQYNIEYSTRCELRITFAFYTIYHHTTLLYLFIFFAFCILFACVYEFCFVLFCFFKK